jgi:hypothetical protein
MKEILEYKTKDDEVIQIVVESADATSGNSRVENVSRIQDRIKKSAENVKVSFEDSLDSVKKLGENIFNKLKSIDNSPDEIDVQFGLKLTAEAGVVITNIGGEVHVNVSMKWKNE